MEKCNFNMENKKECYTIVIIPEQKYKSCYGCKYYENRMLKSGLDPLYMDNCTHSNSPMNYNMRGNLVNMFGRVETPEWCPIGEMKE